MTLRTLALAAALVAPVAALSQTGGIIAPGAELTLIADGFGFTEGPAADAFGNVYFTDQPNDRIMKWNAANGATTVFLSPSGRSNGMYFDRDGSLVSTADAENELWAIAPDGSHTVLLRKFDGKEFNGPNDLWIHPQTGDIYFTDPLYARPWWTHRGREMQQDGRYVYRFERATEEVTRAADGFEQPNGIIGTPDGKTLYVADIEAGKTYAYDIAASGKLKNGRLFAPIGSDGMTIDERGNIYFTGKGVDVFDSEGRHIEHIEVPQGWTANVTFGGSDGQTLFITASKAVYGLKMNVKGAK